MLKTSQIQDKYNISRQTLYSWAQAGILHVNKDWKGHYDWDAQAVHDLETILNRKQKSHQREYTLPTRFHIQNRRYLGSKEKLLPFIDQVVKEHTKNVRSVADIFAGTGVVSDMFVKQGKHVITNDILHSNYCAYQTFFGNAKVDIPKLEEAIHSFNNFSYQADSYLVRAYGGRYFTKHNASKIDQARQWVQNHADSLNERERAILITTIFYAADKVANTVGHYDAYRANLDQSKRIWFRLPAFRMHNPANLYEEDANRLVDNIKADLVYIDTPYNSRQYVDSYHVLENITDWKMPDLVGKARKSNDRLDRKSAYNLVNAPQAFDDLIQHIHAKYVLVSFNNMAKKGVGRSNAKISNDEIMATLEKRGKVQVFSQAYQPFSTGKTHLTQHKELLYLLKIDE